MTTPSPQVSKNLGRRVSPFVMEAVEELTKDTGDRVSFGGLVAKSFIVKRLKTFPEVAQRLMSILTNPDFKMGEIEALIRQDPALMASVIRLANSAIFSGSRRVEKIETAFMRLGREKVADIVASVATMGTLRRHLRGGGRSSEITAAPRRRWPTSWPGISLPPYRTGCSSPGSCTTSASF